MIVVVDASVLVAELLRARGRRLFGHPDLRAVVADDQWSEARHELGKRLVTIVGHGRMTEDQAASLSDDVDHLIESRVIEVIPRDVYEHMEPLARHRVPRDSTDWPVVALALTLSAGILTADNDFLGCGCPTWTVETLSCELGRA